MVTLDMVWQVQTKAAAREALNWVEDNDKEGDNED